VAPQTTPSSILPPSTGNPGNAFKPAKSKLRKPRFRRIVEKTSSVASAPSQKTPARARVVNGPAAAIRNDASGPRSLECVSV
jgi:hypothetical protein